MPDLLDRLLTPEEFSKKNKVEVPASPQSINDSPEVFPLPAKQEAAQTPTVRYPNKPEPISDDGYEYLISNGFSPESISKAYSPYSPEKDGGFMTRMYELSNQKPQPIDEKKVRNAKILGSIGDSLGLLSQMWSAGKGAHIRNRDYNQSASSQLSKEEKELRNIYLNQTNKYNEGFYNARLKDFLNGQQEYETNRKGIQGTLQSKRKLDQDIEKARQVQANADRTHGRLTAKDEATRELNERKYSLQEENTQSLIKSREQANQRGWATVNNNKRRTDVYVANGGGGAVRNNKTIQLRGKNGEAVDIPNSIWTSVFPSLVADLEASGTPKPKSWVKGKGGAPGKFPSLKEQEAFVLDNINNLSPKHWEWMNAISGGEGAVFGEESEEESDDDLTGGMY